MGRVRPGGAAGAALAGGQRLALLVDPDVVAGRIAEGAVADAPRLIRRLLDDLGAGAHVPNNASVPPQAIVGVNETFGDAVRHPDRAEAEFVVV